MTEPRMTKADEDTLTRWLAEGVRGCEEAERRARVVASTNTQLAAKNLEEFKKEIARPLNFDVAAAAGMAQGGVAYRLVDGVWVKADVTPDPITFPNGSTLHFSGADPLEPEPEDDEETITYPDVWDRAGDRVVIWSCVAALALFWGAPIALSVWAVTR